MIQCAPSDNRNDLQTHTNRLPSYDPNQAEVPAKLSKNKRLVAKISINSNTIFDESADGTMVIHYLANWTHITTKSGVIVERLPFKEGDLLDEEDLLEAERIVRSQAYIRDVKITFKENCDINELAQIEIQTWDNWSFIPTVSFGRKGGENKLSIGVKEDNVLGTGVRARFKYNSDKQRNGYQFTLRSPFPAIPYSTVFIDFVDNDEGQLTQLELDKPFYHINSDYMFNVSFLNNNKTEDIFQNGLTRNSFNENSHFYSLSGGWQLSHQENQSMRIKFGFVDDSAIFEPSQVMNSQDGSFLPLDKNFQYPWVDVEYLERKFETMHDVYLINQTKDINLGWHHEVKFGVELNDVAQGNDTGYNLHKPLSVGDDTGVRGYPLQYQHGDTSFSSSIEARFYTDYNILKILDLGFVAFADAGKAWGSEQSVFNETDSLLTSIGAGVRLYSSRSSHKSVLVARVCFSTGAFPCFRLISFQFLSSSVTPALVTAVWRLIVCPFCRDY